MGLYKGPSAEGNPEFATIMKVLKAFQLHISVSASPDAFFNMLRYDIMIAAAHTRAGENPVNRWWTGHRGGQSPAGLQ